MPNSPSNFSRYPAILSERGYPVLNIQRPGYGGNALPTSKTPLSDSLSVITELISQVHDKHANSGVILVGHSIGAAIALAIAAQSNPFPVLGASVLGVVPTPERDLLIPHPDPQPDEPRFVIDEVITRILRFFGPFECLNEGIFTGDNLQAAFEPGMNLVQNSLIQIVMIDYLFSRRPRGDSGIYRS